MKKKTFFLCVFFRFRVLFYPKFVVVVGGVEKKSLFGRMLLMTKEKKEGKTEREEKGRRKREKERSSSFSETSFFVSFFFFVSLFLFSLRHSFIDHRLAPDRSAKFVLLRRAGQNRRAWFLSLLKQSVKLLFLLFSAPLEVLSFFFPAQFRTIAALSAASILVAAPTLAAF